MQTMALTMQKGGTGKTTSALNIGAFFASVGHRVLLVDMDGQQNLSAVFRCKDKDRSVYEFLLQGGDIPLVGVGERLWLLPGSNMMHRFDANVLEHFREFPSMVLRNRFEEYDMESEFDVILFDCPPKMDYNTMNVLTYVEWVYMPVNADYFSIQGITETMVVINRLKRLNEKLKIGGIFFTRYDERAILYRSIRDAIQSNYNGVLMSSHVRTNVSLNEAIMSHMDIFSYDKERGVESNGARDYRMIGEAIKKMIGL